MAARIMVTPEEGASALATSERHFYELRRRPDFPRPVQLGPRCVRFFLDELEEWARSLVRQEPQREPPHLAARRIVKPLDQSREA